jgi:hypothetical protein
VGTLPHRRSRHLDPLSAEDRVERGGELGIPIADHKPETSGAVAEFHQQVPGLLGHPLPHWMRRHPEHMDSTSRHLNRNST